jgi:hypothetical protein
MYLFAYFVSLFMFSNIIMKSLNIYFLCSSCAHGNNVCDHNNFCAYDKTKYCMPNWFSIMVNLENDELLSQKKIKIKIKHLRF